MFLVNSLNKKIDIVLSETEHFLIVNKPAGMLVHADSSGTDKNLISELNRQKQSSLANQQIQPNQPHVPQWHLVNRLDKETSGLVFISKKTELVSAFQKILDESEKIYLAVLRGVAENGIWDWPISDKAEGAVTPQGLANNRKNAKSIVTVIQKNQFFTLAEIKIETGRQHQIRKHAKLAGRPVVGDTRYGNPKDNQRIKEKYKFDRMALHAWKLAFPQAKNISILLKNQGYSHEIIQIISSDIGNLSSNLEALNPSIPKVAMDSTKEPILNKTNIVAKEPEEFFTFFK